MICNICPACEKYRANVYHEQSEHTCNIKNLPHIGIGDLMVYNYTKPIYFLFEGYAPGSFCKALPGTTSAYLLSGKESSTIFNYTVCRKPSEGEKIEYQDMVKKSKYSTSQTKILADVLI